MFMNNSLMTQYHRTVFYKLPLCGHLCESYNLFPQLCTAARAILTDICW